MTDASKDQTVGGGKVRRLSDAVRRVRIAEAERVDAFSDLHDAERARLGLLAEELATVFADIPDGDYFICQVSSGTPPRLWIDLTAHVVIGRDRRTYRFVKDTRLGRIVLMETADAAMMADAVTDYIAERVLEQERALDTDLLMARMRLAASPASGSLQPKEGVRPARRRAEAEPASGSAEGKSFALWLFAAFLFGLPTGALAMIVYAWFTVAG